jgi:hypothetical protein
MSTNTSDDGRRNAAELRRMDRETARNTLTVAEYERWEQLQELHAEAEEQRDEWEQAAEEAVETMVYSDATDLAAEVSVFGNDLAVYFSNDDPRVRDAVKRLTDVFDIDPDADEHADITTEDVAEEDIGAAKDVLADLVTAAVVEWNGEQWADLAPDAQDSIRARISADPPDGWGLAGLMDAWVEIQTAVEQNRNERMERVQKFRSEKRRGDR